MPMLAGTTVVPAKYMYMHAYTPVISKKKLVCYASRQTHGIHGLKKTKSDPPSSDIASPQPQSSVTCQGGKQKGGST
jgi:hypothetical protein